jgi:hypothetical protein
MANGYAAEGIDKEHPDRARHSGQWARIRDAVAGQDAVHAGMGKYLPKLKKESNADYLARLKRTPYYNASWRTMSGLLGMIFRKEPDVKTPTAVADFLEDITMTGVPFNVFAEELTYETLGPGFTGILVDHPAAPDLQGRPLVVAEAERLGLRPSMQLYKCETILDWQFRRIRNKWSLSQVRLMENIEEREGEFKKVYVGQIRVLDLDPATGDTYRVRLFRKDIRTGQWEQFGADVVPLMNGKPLQFIPFMFVTPNGTVAEVDDPTLIDLIDLNLQHYMVSADYEHACHFTALPTPWITGLSPLVNEKTGAEIPRELSIGGTTAWIFQNENTNVGYLEFTGGGIDAIEKNLTRKEAGMAAIGARMLAPEKKGAEAFETLAIRHSGENSILSRIAVSCGNGLTQALQWFCDWAGATGEVDVQLNRDFVAVAMDAQTLVALMAAWQGGGLSEDEFFDALKRGDVIRPDKTLEEHQGEIESNPPLGVQGDLLALEGQDKNNQQIGKPPPKDPNKA